MGEVTGGVGGVTLEQGVPRTTPGLGLDIPVNATLQLEWKYFQTRRMISKIFLLY